MDKPCSNDFDGDGDEPSRNEIEISLPESQLTQAIQLPICNDPELIRIHKSSLLGTMEWNARPENQKGG